MSISKFKKMALLLTAAALNVSLLTGCAGQGQEAPAVQGNNDTSVVSQAEGTVQESATEQSNNVSEQGSAIDESSDNEAEKFNVPDDYQPTSQDDFSYKQVPGAPGTEGQKFVEITKYTGSDPDVRFPVKIVENGEEYYVSDISKGVLSGNNTVKSVTVPNIPNYYKTLSAAFVGCASLEKATLYTPYVAEHLFKECTSLKEVVMCNSVEEGSIGIYAFAECTSLKEIIVNNHIKRIDDNAFTDCTSLEKAEFNGGVEEVSGFDYCSALKSFKFKDTVYIGSFSGCTSLTEITIPETVKKVRSGAFTGCTNLKKATFEGNDTEVEEGFGDMIDGLVIYTPGKLSKAYDYAVNHGITAKVTGN